MIAIDPSIFKAYDIRGLYPDQLDEQIAYRLGRAFARVLADGEGRTPGDLRVGLGRDMRLSAPAMAARYADGLRDEGADVLDVGEVGTEVLYFAVGSRDLDGGLQVGRHADQRGDEADDALHLLSQHRPHARVVAGVTLPRVG